MAKTTQPALALAERALLFNQLAALEAAGVPTLRALAMLQLRPATLLRVRGASEKIQQGGDLASAGQHSGLFTPLEVSLLQAAQSAGSPAQLYARLAADYGRQAQHHSAMRSRLLLPAVVLVLALLVQPLPALVAGSLSLFGYLWGVLQPLLGLALLGWLGRNMWARLQLPAGAGKVRPLDGVLLRLPLFGAALARRNSRDFFASLGLLLEAGVPMFEALPKAQACLSNSQLRRDFQGLSQRVQTGQTLSRALQSSALAGHAQLLSLVTSGEASGTLPAVLLAYAQRETQALASFEEQLASWLPRLAYLLVAAWMAYGLLSGAGVGPQLPAELG
jgi:type II secretory pathway component PulF